MASIISPILGWILTIVKYYIAALTVSLIVIVCMKTLTRHLQSILATTKETNQFILGPTKKKKNSRAASMASAKDDHRYASQATKCTPPNPQPSIKNGGVSGHSLAPSPSQNENNVRLRPPDLVDEDNDD